MLKWKPGDSLIDVDMRVSICLKSIGCICEALLKIVCCVTKEELNNILGKVNMSFQVILQAAIKIIIFVFNLKILQVSPKKLKYRR